MCGGDLMQVKEILNDVAKLLKLSNVSEYLIGLENETENLTIPDELEDLILSVNSTNNLIASLYFELYSSVTISVKNNKIKFSEISDKNVIDIKKITTLDGCKVKYKITSDGVKVEENNVVVYFTYLPSTVGINDSIDYYQKINSLMFAYGVAGEFLFLRGDVGEAYDWDKKFKDTMFALMRPRRSIEMPAERWL